MRCSRQSVVCVTRRDQNADVARASVKGSAWNYRQPDPDDVVMRCQRGIIVKPWPCGPPERLGISGHRLTSFSGDHTLVASPCRL